MRAHQLECGVAEPHGGCDRHASLVQVGQFDRACIVQRNRGEYRVAAIALQHAVAHGRRIPEVHAKAACGVGDILALAPRPRARDAAGMRALAWRNGLVFPVDLLRQHDQRRVGNGALRQKITVADARHEVA